MLDGLLARHGDDPNLLTCAAENAIAAGDPENRGALRKSVALAPPGQVALAILGTCKRMLGDERDASF